MKVRYDAGGDFIEVILKDREGTFRKTGSPYIMEKIDADKNVIGFHSPGQYPEKAGA